ncbi:MAG: 4-hydroxythreonine-4-phosphate dehydrogenase PdxA [Bacteroidales bacterium]|nr:4-hydroxythreonine-4-phosphate dehydrogenase PdxA [Bacteroidales bacterium]HOY38678.1 4-hydroxythreonine-4-phosphate dehydrogenase PdxA [Bacteroidales bacterium]HQP04035.1 4-hydroxythreonine-4-phosphate dehydrogenase PdxA [Bacteroidales bacterium]
MDKIRVGISHGDINSISYEVIIKTLSDTRINDMCVPILFGSPKVVAYHRKALNIENFSLNQVRSAEEAHPKRSNIINCIDEEVKVELGKSTPEAGAASYASLECAVKSMQQGKIDVLVTGPINKHNIQESGFHFPGHTEYLAEKFETKEHLMLLVSGKLRVGVATGHIPVKDIATTLTKEKIVSKLKIFNESLKFDFNVRKPRIAVLGLNPHCGDMGVIGTEESDIIAHAIEEARNHKIMALGPYPADGFFGSDNFTKFDGVLAMYHDQGLAPFKALAFDTGVNFTAGLPIVRTSPAHGTAYELVGTGQASEESFRNALYLAIDIFKNRQQNKELMKNAMKDHGHARDFIGSDDDVPTDENDL